MKIYNYDKVTKEFVCESTASESPLEPGVFLIPAFATSTKPPKVPKRMVAIFDETSNEWEVIENNRGVVFNTTTQESVLWTDFGILPNNYTSKQKPEGLFVWDGKDWVFDIITKTALDVIEKRAAKLQQIREIIVTIKSGKSFDGDEESQNRIVRALSRVSSTGTLSWKLADNTIVEVSKIELQEALDLATQTQDKIWLN